MAYPPVTDSWRHTLLALNNLPAIQSPDFIICDRIYAGSLIDLNPSECMQAAGRLPVGSTEMEYQRHFPYYLTTQTVTGECRVEVAKLNRHNPHYPSSRFMAKPDVFRDLAAQIIRQCVIPRGHGRFATFGMQNLINWATNGATTSAELFLDHIPPDASFFTVSVMGTGFPDDRRLPADLASRDPAVAYSLAFALDQASHALPDGSDLKEDYEIPSATLEDRGDEMERGEFIP